MPSPLQRFLQFAGSSGGGGPLPDTYARAVAYCDAPVGGIDEVVRFINLFNASFYNYSTATPSGTTPVDFTTYLPKNMPVNDTMSMNIFRFSPPQPTWRLIKAGHYIFKWNGSALTPTITGAGVSGVTQINSKRYEFDLAQVNSTDPWGINVSWHNGTGSATNGIDAGTLVCCHEDYEALWNSGEYWNPDYITFLGENVSYYRSAKGSGVEGSQVINNNGLDTVLTHNHLVFGSTRDGDTELPLTTGIPADVVAQLCARLQCDYLINFPIGGSDEVYQIIANQAASMTEFQGNFFPEVGNENWNFSYSAPDYITNGGSVNSWLATYAGLHGLASQPEAEAHIAMRAAKALIDAGVPEARVRLTLAFQVAQDWVTSGYADQALNLVDTENLMGKGNTKKVYEIMEEMNGQILVGVYSTPNNGSSDMYHARIQQVDWATRTDGQIDTFFDNGTAESSDWLDNMVAYLTGLSPALLATAGSYEMGHQYVGGDANFGQFNFTIDSTNNRGTTVDFQANATNGDAVYFWGAHPFTTWTDRQYYIRMVDADHFRVYLTRTGVGSATDTYANDAAAKAAAIVLDGVTGPFQFSNQTRCTDSFTRLKTYFDGAVGAACYDRMWTAWIGANRCRAWCQSVDVNGYLPGPTFAYLHGLKGGIYASDTERYTNFIARTTQ